MKGKTNKQLQTSDYYEVDLKNDYKTLKNQMNAISSEKNKE